MSQAEHIAQDSVQNSIDISNIPVDTVPENKNTGPSVALGVEILSPARIASLTKKVPSEMFFSKYSDFVINTTRISQVLDYTKSAHVQLVKNTRKVIGSAENRAQISPSLVMNWRSSEYNSNTHIAEIVEWNEQVIRERKRLIIAVFLMMPIIGLVVLYSGSLIGSGYSFIAFLLILIGQVVAAMIILSACDSEDGTILFGWYTSPKSKCIAEFTKDVELLCKVCASIPSNSGLYCIDPTSWDTAMFLYFSSRLTTDNGAELTFLNREANHMDFCHIVSVIGMCERFGLPHPDPVKMSSEIAQLFKPKKCCK